VLIWVISAVICLVLTVSILGCRRVHIARCVSAEGIESDEVVEAYDKISRWPQFRLLRHMIVAELKKHRPNGILVDVGCGPGYLVAIIEKSFPHLRIVGVDIAEEMIQLATSKLSSPSSSGRLEFRQGAVQRLPFQDDAVEFVVSTLSLHHWQNSKQALKEIYRVLKPEGQFLLFDLRRDSRRLFYWLLRFAQTFVVPAPLRRINEPTGSVLSSYTPAELEALLCETSFQEWKVKPGLGWIFVWGRK